MSRAAFLVSLTLHTALLAAVPWWSRAVAPTGGERAPDTLAVSISLVEMAADHALTEDIPTLDIAPPPFEHPTLPVPARVLATAAPANTTVADFTGMQEIPPRNQSQRPRSLAAHSATQNARAGSLPGEPGTDSGYMPPRFKIRYAPPYPARARAEKLTGTVLLIVSVDARGRVTLVRVAHSSGHTLLDDAAAASVRAWRFEPATRQATPLAAQVEVPVRFRIAD